MKNTQFLILLSILSCCTSLISHSQNNLSGRITSEVNGEPLVGANIVIKNTTIGTSSDRTGYYEIKGIGTGNYLLRISFFGYETIEKEISFSGKAVEINVTMKETSIDLNTVVVTGTRTEKTLKNSPVLTQAISIRELEKKDALDITDALENVVPGFEVKSQAQGKSISLQGVEPQYMLFLLDGERMAGETYGDIDYSRINMADIERIEIIKGSASTLYGSNALGGVVNIISKKPARKFELNASNRFSNFNTQNYRLSIGNKLGKISFQTSATYDYTDGYDLVAGNSYRTQEKENALVINEHLKYSPSEKWLIESHMLFMTKNRDNTSAELYDRRNQDFTIGARASFYMNPGNSITFSWNTDNYNLLNKIKPDSLVSDYNNNFSNGRILGNFQISGWNLLTVGTEYINENLTAPRNQITDKTNRDLLAFAQEDLKISPQVNLIGGLRIHHNSEYDWHFTPQITAMCKIWIMTVRGTLAQGYRTPTLKEKYMTYKIPAPGPPMFLVGNEALNPEKSDYSTISMEYNRSGISFSVSAFRNKFYDMIDVSDTYIVKPKGIIEYNYLNQGEVTLKGVDVMLKAKMRKNLMFDGAITLVEKKNDLTGKVFNNVRKFSAKGNLDYNIIKKKYLLNLNLQSNFYGKNVINLMDEKTHQTKDVPLRSYSLWKLTTTQSFKSVYHVKLGIQNILNFKDDTGGYNNGTPGRTFFAGLGISI